MEDKLAVITGAGSGFGGRPLALSPPDVQSWFWGRRIVSIPLLHCCAAAWQTRLPRVDQAGGWAAGTKNMVVPPGQHDYDFNYALLA